MTQPLFILGAGGLAREVAWLAEELGEADVRLIDADEEAGLEPGSHLVAGMGSPHTRAMLLDRHPVGVWTWTSLVSKRAHLGPSVVLGPGSVVASGCILTVDVEVGAATMLNLGVTVGHDARIGSACMINPSVNISGGVSLGNAVLVGTGAQILEGLTIGDGATVGAGAVVTRDVVAGDTVVGVPARSRSDR